MSNIYTSLFFTSLVALVFIAFAIHMYIRTREKILKLYKYNNHLADSYVELQNNCQTLEQKQRDNTAAMRILSHDLRGPLAGIMSASTLMLMDDDRSEEDTKLLTLIKDSGASSTSLINELLNNKSKLQLEKERNDLYEILDTCTYLLNFQAAAKSQKILFDGKSVQLLVNKEKIRRVIINLVTNAIKFSYENSYININLKKVNNEAVISIRDQGIGIPSFISEDIFENTEKGKRLGTAKEQSFGMGLSISKQIVEEHGGRIWFENNKPSGSTFYVALPLNA